MIQETQSQKQLYNLYQLLEVIKQKRLGLDWQSKLFYNNLEKEVIEKIKNIETSTQPTDMVK
jgi:hypothetical protein